MKTIEEAYEKYVAAEDAAAKEYLEFWLEKFKTEGINFTPSGARWWHPYTVEFNGYNIDAYTNPSRYTGIKLNIFLAPYIVGSARYYTVKVKSETGFNRLIRKLYNQGFK